MSQVEPGDGHVHDFVLDELVLEDGQLHRVGICECGATGYAANPTERRPPLDGAGDTR